MYKIVLAVFSVTALAANLFAGDMPYTFGMPVAAPSVQSGSLAVVQPTGATAKVVTVTTGGVERFSVTATGAMTSTSFAGSGAGLTAVPAASIAAGSLGVGVIASSHAVNSVLDASIVGMSSSKLSGALPAISGAALTTLTPGNISAGALNAVTDLTATGQSVFGTLPNVSTVTASGDISVGNVLSASYIYVRNGGWVLMGGQNLADLLANTPLNRGEVWFCLDCTKDTLVVSTGTTVGAVSSIFDRTVLPQ